MEKKLELGSLFDGSGGFPLAGVLHGIEPVWASEIEPFPIRVTKARFPNMKHLGSVTDVNGAEVEPVDIITFGSPCQDLSVAGKQLGIHDGQRSNLFFEAIRIIKEMRNATADNFPRFAVWENVPGAFSSNKGKDFQAVLQSFCQIRGGANHIVPMPPKNKWLPAGCIVGDGWSVAWRVYDAQFWGVPQRRKRIYLIADFGSERAGEILFERESVRGDSETCGEAREGTAEDAEGSAGRSDRAIGCDLYNGQLTGDKAATLGANSGASANHAGPSVCYKVVYPINTMVATRGGKDDMRTCFGVGEPGEPQFTISAAHEHAVCYALEGNTVDRDAKQNGCGYFESVCPSLNTQDKHAICYPDVARSLCARHDSSPCVDRGQNVVCYTPQAYAEYKEEKPTLRASGGDNGPGSEGIVCYGVDCRNATLEKEKTHTIQAKANGGISLNCTPSVVYDCRGNGDGQTVPTLTGDHQNRVTDYTAVSVYPKVTGALCAKMNRGLSGQDAFNDTVPVIRTDKPPRKYIVRRLTPLECLRLQGLPDWWCDGVDGSDSAKYKMCGNGIAIPCAEDVIGRVARALREETT